MARLHYSPTRWTIFGRAATGRRCYATSQYGPGRYREGYDCTTSGLRAIFPGAYTGRDWHGQV
ncbi:MAG: hypothetical protein WBQ89_11175, partial [Candidatus Acidiferrum sp.]